MCPIMPLPFVTYLTATDFESVANLIASPDVWLHSPTTPGLALSFVTPSGRREYAPPSLRHGAPSTLKGAFFAS